MEARNKRYKLLKGTPENRELVVPPRTYTGETLCFLKGIFSEVLSSRLQLKLPQ